MGGWSVYKDKRNLIRYGTRARLERLARYRSLFEQGQSQYGEMMALAQARRSSEAGGVYVGPSALGVAGVANLGLRPRLVCVGPSALNTKSRQVCRS